MTRSGSRMLAASLAIVTAAVLAGCGGVEARRLEAEKAAAVRAEQERRAEERYALETACAEGDAEACRMIEPEEGDLSGEGAGEAGETPPE